MSQAEEHEALVACVHEVLGEHIALLKGEGDVIARAVLAVVSEKAKEPTERMRITWAKSEAWVSPDSAWRAMLAVSPLVKPEENPK